MLIPIEPWDRKAGLEAWRKWLEEHYRVEITWIEPKTPQPTDKTPAEERKAHYANPPEIPDLDKAADADVIFTALTHVAVNEKQSELLLKLLTTKPVVGGRRSHHAMNLKLPKGVTVPGVENAGRYGGAIFGGEYAGHHGGTQQIKVGLGGPPDREGAAGPDQVHPLRSRLQAQDRRRRRDRADRDEGLEGAADVVPGQQADQAADGHWRS